MTRQISPAGRLLTAATAVVLFRGGLVLCTDLVLALESALKAFGPVRGGELEEIAAAAGEVIDGRLDADVMAFDQGRDRLSRALAGYWAGRALSREMMG